MTTKKSKIGELEKMIAKAQLQPGLKEVFELHSKFEEVKTVSDCYQQVISQESVAITSNNSGGY